jgi:two-component system sensor histidine kinase BaeS
VDVARTLAASAAVDYERAGGWAGVDLDAEQAGASAESLHLVVRDADGSIVLGGPVGPNFDNRAVGVPVVVGGKAVGTVLVEPRSATGPTPLESLSHWWFLTAALVAGLIALAVAYLLARRMMRPIDGYIATARAFAAGDHSARPTDLGPPEFQDLTRALSAAADEIERSETARRQLTDDIAHELRTPLAALQAGLEELRDGYLEADHQTLSALHDQAARLGRIVEDLSALAAAESMTLELHRRPLDLAEVVGLAVASWARTLQAAGISVEEDLPPGVIVHADADRVHQIIDNLLANAARYCRVGDSVHVSVAPDGKQGLLRVADTGPGFRAEELPVVFQRTWRGTASTGTRGSGLGLPIVRALAQAHAGTVEVTSVEGQGATITVRLPSPTPGG